MVTHVKMVRRERQAKHIPSKYVTENGNVILVDVEEYYKTKEELERDLEEEEEDGNPT